jgi:glycosyltransferase involved in cell wall biosynthesis
VRPIVFVIPWFHEGIGGGAEVNVREYATHLMARGHEVEVWTTCCRDFHDNWNVDHWPVGETEVFGIPTRRFPVRQGDHAAFNGLNARLLGGDRLSLAEEAQFFEESIRSDAMVEHIRDHGVGKHLIFTPYLYGTTFEGLQALPEWSLLLSEFHDEPYAHLAALRSPVESAQGYIFLAEPEQALANRVFAIGDKPQVVTGMGFDELPDSDPAAFRAKHGLGDTPFILFAGRQSAAKNLGVLLDLFTQHRRAEPERSLKLVLIGKEDMPLPRHPDIFPLGFVSPEEKLAAHRAATLLCQPSVNESFSIVLMESWLSDVPVLVNGWCEVTRHHCEASGGGLWFRDGWEFREALNWMLDHPEARTRMASQGRSHVRRVYAWDALLDRFEGLLREVDARRATFEVTR